MCEWGGFGIDEKKGDLRYRNIFHWYWAIAESGRPADLDAAEIASWLDCSIEHAQWLILRADLTFRDWGRSNERTGAYQRLARHTKLELLRQARGLGLKVTGFDPKADLIGRIVDATLPVIRFANGDAYGASE